MNEVFLLIGGNIEPRMKFLQLATNQIEVEIGKIVHQSCMYETAAWGKLDQSAFLNQVLQVSTMLSAEEILETILTIETQLGRVRQEKMGPRKIDIDILYFNQEKIDKPHLTIPHPHLQNRRFVLVPLVEIAKHFLHPILKKTSEELLHTCNDFLEVKKYNGKI